MPACKPVAEAHGGGKVVLQRDLQRIGSNDMDEAFELAQQVGRALQKKNWLLA
ncbi:MAG: hypothetical protein JWR21_3807, partial [Herminiimonas sp.]|nr:hypothetical protein [Herminiimonas sp.]